MTVMTLLGVVMIAGAGQLPPVEPPPIPDFKQPVDYMAWYDAQMKFAATNNALDMYGVFLYGNDNSAAPKIAAPAKTKAAEDLLALLGTPEPWYPEKQKELGQWTALVEARYLGPFSAAAQRQFYAMRREPEVKLLAEIKTPMLSNGRAIGQMMFARAWRVVKNTIFTDRLLDAVRDNLVFARHISLGGTLDEQFFAMGHRAFVYEQLRRALPSNVHTLEFWRSMLKLLEEHDDRPATEYYARSLYFSEAAALQLLQHFCTEVGSNGVETLSPSIKIGTVEAYYSEKSGRARFRPPGADTLPRADPVELARLIHEYYESMRKLLMAGHATDLAKKTRQIEADILSTNHSLETMISPLGLTVQSAYSIEATRRMARLFLHMAVKYKTTDTWPMSLDELNGADLAALRIDPLSGKEFLVQPLGPRTALYSVGSDGVDDQGKPGKDVVYWAIVAKEVEPLDVPSTPREQSDETSEGAEGKEPDGDKPADKPADPPEATPAGTPAGKTPAE